MESLILYNCETCNKPHIDRRCYFKRNKHHFCSRECQVKWQKVSRIGSDNPYYKHGKKNWNYHKTSVNGIPTNTHKLIMEKHIGRPLMKGEEIHHIDGDTSNNNIMNLKLCESRAEHRALHRR